MDVSNRRMIFSSAVALREDAVDSIRDMPFENLYEIVAKHTWPEKAEVPGARCDQVCREWTAVLRMEGSASESAAGRETCISIAFSYRSLMVGKLRDRKSKACVRWRDTICVCDIQEDPFLTHDAEYEELLRLFVECYVSYDMISQRFYYILESCVPCGIKR